MSQSNKGTSKLKRGAKERDKRKSLAGNQDANNTNANEKTSPTRENHSKRYAGLNVENIKAAAEHVMFAELLSEESCELLAEDLNYKLRYIIHQAANRAFISNRTGINSKDVEETFADLQLDKSYGASSDPSWLPLADQNYLYLDDVKVNLRQEAEEEIVFFQTSGPIVQTNWLPELKEPNNSLKNYFKITSEAVVSNDIEIRRMALQNISSNPNIGPIINWFYKFGYVLLSKDMIYDSLTFYALDLIETLELSPIGNTEAGENQIRLLVRLILQRLLKSYTNPEVLKPMCWVLAILCARYPLKQFVLAKLKQKLPELTVEYSLPFLMLVNSLGMDAIMDIFVENFEFFFKKLSNDETEEKPILNNGCSNAYIKKKKLYNWQLHGSTIMETYSTLIKNGIHEKKFGQFPELDNFSILLSKPHECVSSEEPKEIDFINMKKQLIKTRKKIEMQRHRRFLPYESVFEVPVYKIRMKQKMENHYKTNYHMGWKKQSHIVIGKTSLLLPVMRNKTKILPHCHDHSLFSYNL